MVMNLGQRSVKLAKQLGGIHQDCRTYSFSAVRIICYQHFMKHGAHSSKRALSSEGVERGGNYSENGYRKAVRLHQPKAPTKYSKHIQIHPFLQRHFPILYMCSHTKFLFPLHQSQCLSRLSYLSTLIRISAHLVKCFRATPLASRYCESSKSWNSSPLTF